MNWFSSLWTAAHRYLTRPWSRIAAGLGAIALVLSLLVPARANTIQISPTAPQLGETVAVIIPTTSDIPPIVTMDGTSYSAFPLDASRYRALIPTTPLDQPGRKTIQVTSEGETRQFAITLRNRSFPTQRIWVRGGGSGGSEVEMRRVREFRQLVTPQKFWQGAFARPADGRVTSVYGVRRYYNGVFADDYYHRGVDYAGPTGSRVLSPAAGRVVLVGRESQGFRLHGNTIGIDHGQGVLSIFIHLNRIDVQEGDLVQRGQVIGGIGATGSATGPNLHWGLYVNGKAVDPEQWRAGDFG